MSDILAPIWDSPPTSSEDWKKDEKDLTLSLGVQGYLKPSTVSCSLLGNTSLEWWRLLLVFSQHEEGTPPHPTVLLALKPFFMGYSIQAASWGQQQLTPQDGQQTTRCFLSEGQRVPCRALCYGGPAAAPSLCGPYGGVKSTWLGICQVLSGHLWRVPHSPDSFFSSITRVMSLCCRFVISTKCIIVCEAFQHSLGWDAVLERCFIHQAPGPRNDF